MRDVVLPKGKPAGETHAYSLEEIMQMLKVLPESASTIVAVAAFTGVRKGELHGFLWENYTGEQVLISQSFWRGMRWSQKPEKAKRRCQSSRNWRDYWIRTEACQAIPQTG
ncbi:MAG TPA: hypothetical protein VNY51_13350 [Candidatus Dormibacteraeota bacterium]|nr:hypothetical protein [Candidatus Dormibacteraeota bacterium]